MSDEAVYGPKVFELRVEHGIALRVLRDLEIRVIFLSDIDQLKNCFVAILGQIKQIFVEREPRIRSQQFVISAIDVVEDAELLRGQVVLGHIGSSFVLITTQTQFPTGHDALSDKPTLKPTLLMKKVNKNHPESHPYQKKVK